MAFSELLVFSAASVRALADTVRGADASDIHFLTQRLVRAPWQPHRLAIVASSPAEFDTRRQQALALLDSKPDATFVSTAHAIAGGIAPPDGPVPTACVFPGFGVRQTTVLADLVAQFPFVERWLDRFGSQETGSASDRPSGRLHATVPRTLDAVLLADLALWTVLRHVGLRPDVLAGHSFGEHALLVASGMVSDPQALASVLTSISEVTGPLTGHGASDLGLLAVSAASRSVIDEWLAEDPPRIHVSLDNCPQQLVVWGHADALLALEQAIKARGEVTFRLKDLGQPVHTPWLPISDAQLRERYERLPLQPPAFETWSAAEVAPFPADLAEIRTWLARQWRTPVRFRELVLRLHERGIRTIVEVGPADRLTGFVRDTLRGTGTAAIATNAESRDTGFQLLMALAQLVVRGHDLELWRLQEGQPDGVATVTTASPLDDAPREGDRERAATSLSSAPVPPTAPANRALSASHTERVIAREVARLLDTSTVDPDLGFFQLGLDSVGCIELAACLSEQLQRPVPQTAPFDHPSIRQLARALDRPAPIAPRPRTPALGGPVAIVGMSCRLPGAIDSPDALWSALVEGQDLVTPVPADRWSADIVPDADIQARIAHGAFLDDVRGFDAGFFGISPREAVALDPQQRLLLEGAWLALEHAAISPAALAGTPTGVFVGISGSDYASRLTTAERIAAGGYLATGTSASTAAGRISFALGFEGPCLAVDTACSSSLVAVHLAVESLRRGECAVAIAGGVNLLLNVETSLFLAHGRALSPRGRCATFDAAADGYVRGEGCATVVLKRLADAQADGDRVIAVIHGSAVNHDGRTSALTVPNGSAQERVIRAALADAGVSADEVTAIEAHGTGTALGDPIEIDALSRVFGARPGASRLGLGAVKANLGHLEAAAGIVGLMKMALQIRHRRLTPTPHFSEPNPRAAWASLGADVTRTVRPWEDRVCIGGVSAFGISGTNAHVVLGEAPLTTAEMVENARPWLLPLAARSPQALRTLAGRLAAAIAADPAIDVASLARTLALGRTHFRCRAFVVASTRESAYAALERLASNPDAVVRRTPVQRPSVGFQFTGQGSQWPRMGRALDAAEPIFSAALHQCDEALAAGLSGSIREVMFGDDPRLHQTGWAQPAVFAYGWALAELFAHWGIRGDLLTGHSLGEITAACRAGVFDLDTAARVVAVRAARMQALPSGGGMIAVETTRDRIETILKGTSDLDIAAVNAPDRIVVSGPDTQLRDLSARLTREGIRSVPLTVSHAFHSSLMAPAVAALGADLASLHMDVPAIPVVSNVTGRVHDGAIATAAYWLRHLREPVMYADVVATMVSQGSSVVLELGPRAVLTTIASHVPGAGSTEWIAAVAAPQDEHASVLDALGRLYCAGVDPDWAAVMAAHPGPRATLPGYPFEREAYWLESGNAGIAALAAAGATENAPSDPPAIANTASESPRQDKRQQRQSGLRERLAAAAADDRPALLTRFVQAAVGGILQLPADRPIDPHEPFTTAGMDSLMALQLAATIERELGISLTASAIIDRGTVSKLVATILSQYSPLPDGDHNRAANDADRTPGTRGGATKGPLSHGQRALWFLRRLAPDSVAYNQSLPLRLVPTSVEQIWREAAERLVARHPMLRTRFVVEDDEPVQVVDPPSGIDWRAIAVKAGKDASTGDITAVLTSDHAQLFDLASKPPIRFRWIRGDEECVLLLTMHHIACDGWSLELMRRDLSALAHAISRRETPESDPPRHSYLDYVDWQRRLLAGPQGAQLRDYWLGVLAGPRARLQLPTDRPRPSIQSYAGAAVHATVPDDLAARMRSFAKTHETTLFSTLLAAYAAMLAQWTGQRDLLIGVPASGRGQSQFADVVGYFVSPLVMRLHLAPSTSGVALTEQAARVTRDALEHADYPFPLLVQQLGDPPDPSRSPVFDVTFNFVNRRAAATGAPAGADAAPDAVREITIDQADGKFDLTLNVIEDGEQMTASLGYNADLFDRQTINDVARRFLVSCEALVTQPDSPVLAETTPQTPALSGRRVPVESLVPVHRRILDVARERPEAIAVSDGQQHLSFAELVDESRRLAQALCRRGVGPDVPVAIISTRSIDFVISVLAVLLADGAYVPIEHTLPATLRDSMLARIGANVRIDSGQVFGQAAPRATTAVDPMSRLAYVMFTSGSTGTPKAVGIEHRSLANYVASIVEDLELVPGARHAMVSSVAADLGHTVFFPSLATGGTLCLAPDDVATDPAAFAEFMRTCEVDYLKIVPSHLAALLDTDAPVLPRLGLILGGEATSTAWAHELRRRGGCRVVNHYGPTETTVGVLTGPLTDVPDSPTLPLTTAVANVDIWILDADGQPAGAGALGEVVVRGPSVARGYVGDPALTAERFPELPGIGRAYRTGDLARMIRGKLHLVGRADRQIKLRGYRVELEQIEHALRSHPRVAQSVVLPDVDGAAASSLAAWIVPADPGDADRASSLADGASLTALLSAWLSERLPPHMVPARIEPIDRLPLTANGKVDAAALRARIGDRGRSAAPPRNLTELRLQSIWQSVLGSSGFSVDDDFFDRGGHSLAAVRLAGRIESEFGVRVPLATFFLDRTIRRQAGRILELSKGGSLPPLVPIRRSGRERPLILFPGAGGSPLYFDQLVQCLDRARPVWAARAIGLGDGRVAPTTVQELASVYVDAILEEHLPMPVDLAGHSFGALVAFEVACQLQERGIPPGWVGVLDNEAPAPASGADADDLAERDWIGYIALRIERLFGTSLSGQGQVTDADSLAEALRASGWLSAEAGRDVVYEYVTLYQANVVAARRYCPEGVSRVPLTVFRAADHDASLGVAASEDPAMGWTRWTRATIETVTVAGTHISMLQQPAVAILAASMEQSLTTGQAR